MVFFFFHSRFRVGLARCHGFVTAHRDTGCTGNSHFNSTVQVGKLCAADYDSVAAWKPVTAMPSSQVGELIQDYTHCTIAYRN